MKILLLFFILFIASCSSTRHLESQSIIGVFEASKTHCLGSTQQISSCNEIVLLEFVKGNFFSVSIDEIAFVIWRGDKQSELLYIAHKLAVLSRIPHIPYEINISSDAYFHESVTFTDSESGIYKFGDINGEKSIIRFKLLSNQEINLYQKTYPGNH